jgi:hypothetical protein
MDELTHSELVVFAESRGGRLVSLEFLGNTEKHSWSCARDHAFEASPRLLIMGGYWCPECFPTVDDHSEWDYVALSSIDSLLRRFYHMD